MSAKVPDPHTNYDSQSYTNNTSIANTGLPDIRSHSSLAVNMGEGLNSSMDSGPSQERSSPPKGRPVYLIGGSEYGRHKRNLSHSALQIGVAEIADTNANLKQIAEYETTIKNRVQYLEKEEQRMLSKMTVIKKRVDLREAAIKAKQQEQLRQALRSKRELAIQEQRKAAVKEKMLQRLQDKNAAEERKAKQRGDAHKKNVYDKMLAQVEREMNEETALIKNFNRAERVKLDRKRRQEEKVMLQQSLPVNKDMIMQETMGDMKGYIATRQTQIDALEKKEKELIDRIQKTQANQNALIQRQVQEVSKPNRSSRDVLSKAGLDLDTMDPLVYEIDDICTRQGGRASNIHPTKWKRY